MTYVALDIVIVIDITYYIKYYSILVH